MTILIALFLQGQFIRPVTRGTFQTPAECQATAKALHAAGTRLNNSAKGDGRGFGPTKYIEFVCAQGAVK